MVDDKVLYTDSTHSKANANKNEYGLAEVALKPATYLEELDAVVDADRQTEGKRPLKRRQDKNDDPDGSGPTKQIKFSCTDPESGYMVRDGKPKGFFYLEHRAVDAKFAIITDTHVTPANVHDSQPYLALLDRQSERFNLNPYAVGLDAGYFTSMMSSAYQI